MVKCFVTQKTKEKGVRFGDGETKENSGTRAACPINGAYQKG